MYTTPATTLEHAIQRIFGRLCQEHDTNGPDSWVPRGELRAELQIPVDLFREAMSVLRPEDGRHLQESAAGLRLGTSARVDCEAGRASFTL
ncbi:MAG: hypothetical protein ACRDPR_11095 [Nocardioidaceae bacterium]